MAPEAFDRAYKITSALSFAILLMSDDNEENSGTFVPRLL
jgi:hypothetical protein